MLMMFTNVGAMSRYWIRLVNMCHGSSCKEAGGDTSGQLFGFALTVLLPLSTHKQDTG